jgi:hypothetical protein
MIQIVPALPPATNGVGDYSLAVACVMRREFGLDTLFVVGSEQWQGPEEIEGFAVRKVAARSAEGLEAALLNATGPAAAGERNVLLQLSGYGYSARGCPFWLLEGLKRWRAKQADSRLVTMFHELYAAAGPPWSSTFWVHAAQKMVMAGLARRSDVAVTNIARYREVLERLDSSKQGRIKALAVPSNVCEPLELEELGSRAKNMVVFGLPGSRKRSYETRMAVLQRACEELSITEVHDVGGKFAGIPERIGGVPVRTHGVMGAAELSLLLSSSMAGFLDYPPEFLGKSSIFAAYCAHRLLPVLPDTGGGCRPEADGIECGVHYCGVAKNGQEFVAANPQRIADAAWKWYQGHSRMSHARAFADALLN